MDNTKLVKRATIIDRILKILQGFAIAGMIVPAVFIPLTAIFGEQVIAESGEMTLGVLNLKLAGSMESYLNMPNISATIICMLIGAILVAAAIWYCLRVLREILKPMKEGTPFVEGMSGKVRKLAWAVLIGGGIAELGHVITNIFEVQAYKIDHILNPEAVTSYSYNWTFSLWFVLIALVLFFLSYVFRCGEALQKESDETL
ncbi:MAG: DUF2975 domain-containing protein [Christensenellaceae bacterium]|nr:DUF2975 domain-containing protein [Christensenellaceae bacterium]